MEAYLLDWANLLLRWLHVITAIAWIGSSFYFVFLDSSLLAPTADDLKAKGVDGAIWSVHGGGFYHAQKYMVAPKGGIDSHLHWFYWEGYWTWMSGFALFVVLYLWNAGIFLVMSANVFFWIIPGQRKVVKAMPAGEPVDPVHGRRGKQRSVHNTYFTLPVLVAMLSNHYSFIYSHPQRWAILLVLMLAGALIRLFFVQRHGYKLGRVGNPWPYAAAGVVLLLALIAWLKPAPAVPAAALPAKVSYAQIQPILAQRCYVCHGEAVQQKNLRVDSEALVSANAQLIYQQVVASKLMPLANSTQMTEDERALVGRWFEGQGK